MAILGTVLADERGNGGRLEFVETGAESGGAVLAIDATYPPGGAFPPVHLHPQQEEQFVVREGALTVRVGGEERVYGPGESFVIPRGVAHTMANLGPTTARFRWETRPALGTADFHETLFGLRNDGRTDKGGRPNLLQSAVIARHFRREFVPAKPGKGVQRVVIALLAPLGHALGYRGRYERYSGQPGTEVATIREEVTIVRSASAIFAHIADYTNDPTWRGAVAEMTQSSPGQATVGTTTREVFRSAGVTTVTVAEIVTCEPDRRVAFRSVEGRCRYGASVAWRKGRAARCSPTNSSWPRPASTSSSRRSCCATSASGCGPTWRA